MKASGFVQVVPERRGDGRARPHAHIARVTGKFPRVPLPGAIVVKVVLDIPDVIADAQTVEAAIEAGATTIVFEPEEA